MQERATAVGPRAARRFHLDEVVSVRVLDAEAPDFAAICRNVSASGMLLCVPRALPAGARVEIWMMMPSATASSAFPLRYRGRVVRTERAPEGERMAVHFEQVEIVACGLSAAAGQS